MDKFDLIAYAQSFASFILRKIKIFSIKEIILFGSAARGDFDKNSDIDLFINIQNEKDAQKIEKIINGELKKFYRSDTRKIWLLKGIKNEIKVKIGVLDKWELKRSIISDGIILYGKYRFFPLKTEHFILFIFNPVKDITQRNRLVRKLFGRKEKGYLKKGLLEEIGGKQISSRIFILPTRYSEKIIDLFKKEKIDYKFFEIWSDQF